MNVRAVYWVFRFFAYSVLFIAGEVSFYTVVRLGRMVPGFSWFFQFGWHVDPRLPLDGVWSAPAFLLFGQCSLWMAPAYGLCLLLLIEPLYARLTTRPPWLRWGIYAVVILLWEGGFGALLHGLLGYRIWAYDDAWAILGANTTLAILPAWVVVGAIAERLSREFNHPDVRAVLLRRLLSRGAP